MRAIKGGKVKGTCDIIVALFDGKGRGLKLKQSPSGQLGLTLYTIHFVRRRKG